MSTHDGIRVGSDYTNFLAQAEADESRRERAEEGGQHRVSQEEPPTIRSKIIWYTTLVGSQLTIASTVASLVFIGRDAAQFGPTAEHIIWLVLSAAFALTLSGTAVLLYLQRRRRDRKQKERVVIELTANINKLSRRNLQQHSESNKQINALVKTARRSMHSLEDAEKDVQHLAKQLSEHGRESTSRNGRSEKDGEGMRKTAADDDLTAKERQDTREAGKQLLIGNGTGNKSDVGAATEKEPERRSEDRATEVRAYQASLNRSKENVSNWLERQSQGHADLDTDIDERAASATGPDDVDGASRENQRSSRRGSFASSIRRALQTPHRASKPTS
ncbi:MAG: hypothetical protein M1837_002613 [Sclerophora amabilis]|nr:MAG: hypothetical protein M1837_002613 [Sclerophora amabilis]